MPPIGTAPSAPDPAAVTRALAAEQAALHRYVRALVAPDRQRAEDIAQETLLRAWQQADHLDWTGRPIRLWLFRTARNLAVDAWRRDRTVALGIAAEAARASDGSDLPDVSEGVTDRHVLLAGMRRLPPRQREVLVLVHLAGRSTEDVARTLGIPAGTVKSRTHHAVRALRRALEEDGPGVTERRESSP